jgi:flagellar biosynthesis protein FliR
MFDIDAWIVGAMLLSCRLGAIALLAPALGGRVVPPLIRFTLVLGLSAALAGGSIPANLQGQAAPLTTVPAALIVAVASEIALGAAMALGLNLAFAMFSLGAGIVDVQVGFGLGQVMDPTTQQRTSVLTATFQQLALILFFLFEGHHALMRGLVMSVEHVPLGGPWTTQAGLQIAVTQVTQLFTLGFAMLAPVIFCLMVTEIGLGIVARSLPQMNTLAMGMPVKVLVALAALGAWVAASLPLMRKAHESAFAGWEYLWR